MREAPQTGQSSELHSSVAREILTQLPSRQPLLMNASRETPPKWCEAMEVCRSWDDCFPLSRMLTRFVVRTGHLLVNAPGDSVTSRQRTPPSRILTRRQTTRCPLRPPSFTGPAAMLKGLPGARFLVLSPDVAKLIQQESGQPMENAGQNVCLCGRSQCRDERPTDTSVVCRSPALSHRTRFQKSLRESTEPFGLKARNGFLVGFAFQGKGVKRWASMSLAG